MVDEKRPAVDEEDEDSEECEACGGCGVLETSWDTLGESRDGRVFVDTCDLCMTGKRYRADAAQAVARELKTDILLVRDDWGDGHPASFKDAIVAPLETVQELLERWNRDGVRLDQIIGSVG